MTTKSINGSSCSFQVIKKILAGLDHFMIKYFSAVILDGISTTACIYMASDCAHEEISVFVELERFDQNV